MFVLYILKDNLPIFTILKIMKVANTFVSVCSSRQGHSSVRVHHSRFVVAFLIAAIVAIIIFSIRVVHSGVRINHGGLFFELVIVGVMLLDGTNVLHRGR